MDDHNKKYDLINKTYKILDDGFIRVVDLMGDDSAIVQAARISYGKGTKSVSDDRSLIRYLLRNKHTSCFEMAVIKFHIRMPLDVFRQWSRHRTWNFISINEYSTRYSEAIDVKMKTEDSKWRKQSTDNKQGSDGYLSRDIGIYLTDQEKNLHKLSEEVYQIRLNNGVAREQARKDLPLSTYTEFYVKIDLHNLLHFCSLRSDLHAQEEIRMYSNTILEEIIKEWCPLVYEAYNDYVKSAKTLFGYEMEIIKLICSGKLYDAKSKAIELGLISFKENGELKKNREREEFEDKLRYMGILIPWNDLKTN